MRYYSNPAFKRGAFTNPDAAVRREAIDLTKRGIDAARAMGAPMMTLWLGQDGFDYAFQCDYPALWAEEIAGIAEVAAHDPNCMISIEYKPNEPRAYSVSARCGDHAFGHRASRRAEPWRDHLILPIRFMPMNNPPLPPP